MHTTLAEAQALVGRLLPELAALSTVEIVLCPPFPWLTEVSRLLVGSHVLLGAQNAYFEDRGGFTGEVSPTMLGGLCQYLLVGQYERRVHFGDTLWLVNRKLLAAQRRGLKPVLCVGESAEQMEDRTGGAVVADQIESGLQGAALGPEMVIAYDPPWTTIGKAMPPPADYAADMCGHIRDTLASLFSRPVADAARIIYGGSITPRNVASIAALPEVDGALTGAASLNAESFVTVVQAFAAAVDGQ
ncbi:MAG: triosephosphate isomerase [Chloroflexota bacterium]|nr:triosephosphate isomerase [Chloroflexota bacterium]